MRSVVFFNNKGGVGKTTLVCNVASDLASRTGLRVLIIDCDPQCNSTQLVLETSAWDEIYVSQKEAEQKTVRQVLAPLEDGDANIATDVTPISADDNRFGVDILPGHPRMSILEDLLSRAWTDSMSGDIGGLRRTNWVRSALKAYGDEYDVVIFDVGPSLGSLNRTVLIGADYFVTPMGADIFSVYGIQNIAEWISTWSGVYAQGVSLSNERNPGGLEKFGIPNEVAVAHFIGYTVQQYITKSKKGVRRPTRAFEQILESIPDVVRDSLGALTSSQIERAQLRLGDVPNMYSLIPLAQSVNAPIAALTSSDGLAGGQYRQQGHYVETIKAVTDALAINMGVTR